MGGSGRRRFGARMGSIYSRVGCVQRHLTTVVWPATTKRYGETTMTRLFSSDDRRHPEDRLGRGSGGAPADEAGKPAEARPVEIRSKS
jgi:hypothetical protein